MRLIAMRDKILTVTHNKNKWSRTSWFNLVRSNGLTTPSFSAMLQVANVASLWLFFSISWSILALMVSVYTYHLHWPRDSQKKMYARQNRMKETIDTMWLSLLSLELHSLFHSLASTSQIKSSWGSTRHSIARLLNLFLTRIWYSLSRTLREESSTASQKTFRP